MTQHHSQPPPTPLEIQQAAIHAYLGAERGSSGRQRHFGAALSFTGIADNGGLLGGGIENCRETETAGTIRDAVTAFRALGLAEAADLVERADAHYQRMRPGGALQELTDEDEALWEALDSEWFALDVSARLDLLTASILAGR